MLVKQDGFQDLASGMADVINLRQARKRKAREAAGRQAAGNRAKFGRTPAQKARDAAAEEELRRKLDQLRRDPADDPGPQK